MEVKEIDLHGMTHEEAVLKAENFVLLESQNELFECRIITGNSYKMTTKIIKMLSEYGFNYYIPTWNSGEIIVQN